MTDWILSNLKPNQILPPIYYFWSVFDHSTKKKKCRTVVPLPAIGKVKLYLYYQVTWMNEHLKLQFSNLQSGYEFKLGIMRTRVIGSAKAGSVQHPVFRTK